MPSIPIHQLRDRGVVSGIQIEYFNPGDEADEPETLDAHRDDHYLFFLVDKGSATVMIDFHEIQLSAPSLYYILPGQVHHRIKADFGGGWFMAIDTSLLNPEHRQVFEQRMDLQQPIQLSDTQAQQYMTLLCLLKKSMMRITVSHFTCRLFTPCCMPLRA